MNNIFFFQVHTVDTLVSVIQVTTEPVWEQVDAKEPIKYYLEFVLFYLLAYSITS